MKKISCSYRDFAAFPRICYNNREEMRRQAADEGEKAALKSEADRESEKILEGHPDYKLTVSKATASLRQARENLSKLTEKEADMFRSGEPINDPDKLKYIIGYGNPNYIDTYIGGLRDSLASKMHQYSGAASTGYIDLKFSQFLGRSQNINLPPDVRVQSLVDANKFYETYLFEMRGDLTAAKKTMLAATSENAEVIDDSSIPNAKEIQSATPANEELSTEFTTELSAIAATKDAATIFIGTKLEAAEGGPFSANDKADIRGVAESSLKQIQGTEDNDMVARTELINEFLKFMDDFEAQQVVVSTETPEAATGNGNGEVPESTPHTLTDTRRAELTLAFVNYAKQNRAGEKIPNGAITPDGFKKVFGVDLKADDAASAKALKAAVLAWQKKYNKNADGIRGENPHIAADGILGPETYGALKNANLEATLKGVEKEVPSVPMPAPESKPSQEFVAENIDTRFMKAEDGARVNVGGTKGYRKLDPAKDTFKVTGIKIPAGNGPTQYTVFVSRDIGSKNAAYEFEAHATATDLKLNTDQETTFMKIAAAAQNWRGRKMPETYAGVKIKPDSSTV